MSPEFQNHNTRSYLPRIKESFRIGPPGVRTANGAVVSLFCEPV